MAEPTFEKSTNVNLNDLDASLGEGITSISMRRRALARRVLSRRLERDIAFEQSTRRWTFARSTPGSL